MSKSSQESGARSQEIKSESAGLIKSIQESLGVPGLFARILVSRGAKSVKEAEAFLYPRLDDLSDPFLLPDMERGVNRVAEAIVRGEKICLYGDYDADGITSTALMVNFLKHAGQAPETYIPKREEGYGLNLKAVKGLGEKGVELLICLDCGSSNVEEILAAREAGMDVIVIDHHELPEIMPETHALVNPKRKDSLFPTRDLAACGVTFFFLWALRRVMHERGLLKGKMNLKKELDLVTIGTVGDMVPLVKDNRIIVKFGMESMRRQPRIWLKSFLKKNLIPGSEGVNEYALNFIIIPRINATGRVSDPEIALNFLISDDDQASECRLAEMNGANNTRQSIEKKIMDEIIDTIEREHFSERNTLVLYKQSWSPGVIGIVAQKLADMYGKPSIIITDVDGVCKGSGRGRDGINLYEVLTSLSPYLLKYGGHKFACGLSLVPENLIPFSEAFENSVSGLVQSKKRDVPVDTHADFKELSEEFMAALEKMSPFGVGNPRPNLFFPVSDISVYNNGYAKITDSSNTKIRWDGNIQNKDLVVPKKISGIIASPVLRKKTGSEFIHLNIKEIL